MRAARCRAYGPPASVELVDLPDPEPGPGEVLVRVRAAAVNFPDVLIVAGTYQIKAPLPFVPGSEFAGEVEAVGEGVDTLAVGDRVFGTTFVGAFAERVVVAAAAVTRTPDGVEDRHAAAFGVAHRTAFHTLRSVATVRPADEVVVLGAGGGVGLATVQLATQMGASVTAVASTAEKRDAAVACGAVRTVDGRTGDLRTALKKALPGGSDVVVDPVGGPAAEAALRSLRFGGRFVTVGYASGEIPRIPLNLVLLKGVAILGFEFGAFMTNRTPEMQANESELLGLLAAGRAAPHIGAAFPLADVVGALEHVGEGRAVGKVVIDV